ncbi:hypothetical protein Tco_0144121 [Tanacetum coccineum]
MTSHPDYLSAAIRFWGCDTTLVVDLHMCVLVVDEDDKISKLARMDPQVEICLQQMRVINIDQSIRVLKTSGEVDECML